MARTSINDIQRYLGEETVHHQRDGLITRREMMRQLVAICGSAGAAAALLASCSSSAAPSAATSASDTAATGSTATSSTLASAPSSTTVPPSAAAAPTTASTAGATTVPTSASSATIAPATSGPALAVAANDPAVEAKEVTFDGPAGPLLGYVARHASATKPMPGILVIHEIFGLTDHIRDVVRRFAKVGFVVVAVDLTSRAGGTAKGNPSGALGQLSPADALADVAATVGYLKAQKDMSGKIGVTGFCYGGGMTLRVAANIPDLSAAVAYYGPTPEPAEQMKKATAPILAHYGANDARVNAGIASLEANLTGTFVKHLHTGAGHGFNNDTGGGYNQTAAVDAWGETIQWFGKYLL
jgi:carboxymethylenebutenolidase